MAKQPDMYLFTYIRGLDRLEPMVAYKARYITNAESNRLTTKTFDDAENIDNLINYSNKIVVDVGASLGATVVPFSKKRQFNLCI